MYILSIWQYHEQSNSLIVLTNFKKDNIYYLRSSVEARHSAHILRELHIPQVHGRDLRQVPRRLDGPRSQFRGFVMSATRSSFHVSPIPYKQDVHT